MAHRILSHSRRGAVLDCQHYDIHNPNHTSSDVAGRRRCNMRVLIHRPQMVRAGHSPVPEKVTLVLANTRWRAVRIVVSFNGVDMAIKIKGRSQREVTFTLEGAVVQDSMVVIYKKRGAPLLVWGGVEI